MRALVVGFVIAIAMTGFSYWKSDTLAIRSAGAVPVTEQQMPEYHAIMRELTQLADDADAAALRLSRAAAQRLRHRSQPRHTPRCVSPRACSRP